MGILDRLEQIVDGAFDVVTGPLGIPIDMVRSFADPNISFGSAFSGGLEQTVTGLADISQGTGLSALGRGVATKTPLDEILSSTIRELELFYNQEFQIEQDQAPLGLRQLGAKPGEVSIARGLGAATGVLGAALPGGEPLGRGIVRAYQRTENLSPGQLWVANSRGLFDLPQPEREEILASAAHGFESGTIDAFLRWFAQPEVIAGKGIRRVRLRYNPSVEAKLRRFVKQHGIEAAKPPWLIDDLDGRPTNLVMGKSDTPVYTVMRESQFSGAKSDRGVLLLTSKDEALQYASRLHAANPNDAPVVLQINPDGIPVIMDDFTQPFLPDVDGLPENSHIVALLDEIPEGNIDDLLFPRAADLELGHPANVQGRDVTPHLQEQGTLNPKLYNPDGTVIEPGLVNNYREAVDAYGGAVEAFSQGGEEAAISFIRAKNVLDENLPLPEAILSDKRSQLALNWMEGKAADDIRRMFFSQVPGGSAIADMLASATGYAERRAILSASMGIQVAESVTLAPITRARIKALRSEMDAIAQGPEYYNEWRNVYRTMADEVDFGHPDFARAEEFIKTEIATQLNKGEVGEWLAAVTEIAPLRDPPRLTSGNVIRERIRTSTWYQSSLSRPFRSVIEKRPAQAINVHDPQAVVQVVRQLEEAKPLGIGADVVKDFSNRYGAATNEAQRLRVIAAMDDKIVEAAAKKAGFTKEQMLDLIRHAQRGRALSGEILASRRYAPDRGMDVVRHLDPQTGEWIELAMPLLGTQLQNWVPLTDVKAVIRAASGIRRRADRVGITRVPREIIESFYHLWKPSVLLRGGWPIRVVSDEQLRILARNGSLLRHLAAIETGEMPAWTNIFGKELTVPERAAGVFALPATLGTAAIARAASVTAKVAKKAKLIDPEFVDALSRAGYEQLASSRAARGGINQSALQQFQSLMGRHEAGIMDHLIKSGTGQWSTVQITDVGYTQAWQRALGDQIGRDPLARGFLRGVRDGITDVDELKRLAKKWLKDTPEGREYGNRLPWRNVDPTKWLDDVEELIAHYTVNWEPSLVDAALGNKVSVDVLGSIDEALRPPSIHAEIIAQTFGVGETVRYLDQFLTSSFDLFGRLPTDTLSRQPFFKESFAGELLRLRRLNKLQGIEETEQLVERWALQSRNYALTEVKTYLYDLAEVSRFGHMMRFFMPFYPAWQEVIEVWAKLAIADPSVLGRALLLWRSPNRAGLVTTDQDGEEFIQFRLSEKFLRGVGLGDLAPFVSDGGVRFGKTSFNLMLNSPLPGAGPLVQIPINEVVKNKPELEESLKFFLPFGVKVDAYAIALSPLLKRSFNTFINGPEGDRQFKRDFGNILTWMDFQFRTGERIEKPSFEEALSLAKKLNALRMFANVLAPAQPIFDTPLKPYQDIYRELVETQGAETAVETFLNIYGNEFFAVTLSRTVSKTGIPPTVAGQTARKKWNELLTKYPEFGRLIIGEESSLGEFSSAAFAWQLANPPTDDPAFQGEPERTYRELTLDPETGTIEEIDRRLGWQEYIRAMDLLEVERKGRGLPNLRVKDAQDLAQIKRKLTDALGQKYPAWWRDFNQRDDLKWTTTINALRDIAKGTTAVDDDRPDMEGVLLYMEARGLILQELNRRDQVGGSKTIDAVANQDLAQVWDTLVFGILQQNIAFVPIYFRYLEGDPLKVKSNA